MFHKNFLGVFLILSCSRDLVANCLEWNLYDTDYNCGDHEQRTSSFPNDEECQDFCDGYQFVAHWDTANTCRCYSNCDDGYAVAAIHTNRVWEWKEHVAESWTQLETMMVSHTVSIHAAGPGGNTPTASVEGTVIHFDVCNVDSCENNHPVVTVEIGLSSPIIGVRGSFIQESTGTNSADDCNAGKSASTSWYPTVTGHEGYVMFGTPDRVIYGGCDYGRDFGRETNTVSETTVPETAILRFVVTQSVDEESVDIDFSELIVLPKTKTIESCTGQNHVDLIPSGISGAHSTLNDNTINVVVDFPGYMYYHSLEFANSNLQPTFTEEYPVDCSQTGTVAGSFIVDELLQNTDIQANAISGLLFSLDFAGEYFYTDTISGLVEGVPVAKNIPFTVGLPTSTIVNFTFGLEPSSSLMFGIDAYAMGYADDGNRHFSISFHTFVTEGWQFSGDWAEDSTFFISERTAVSLVSTSDMSHGDDVDGHLQQWTVNLYAANTCGERTEEVNLELFSDKFGTDPHSEIVRFQIQLSDTDDCVVDLGTIDIMPEILVSDGRVVTKVDESIATDVYLDSSLEFMISFDSQVLPIRTTLANLDISQNDRSVCPNCTTNDDLDVTCTTCNNELTSPGANFNFSIVLSHRIFATHPDQPTPTSLAIEFNFEYTRRRSLAAADRIKLPLKLNLKDWLCHLPNALLGVAETFKCITPQTTYIRQCNAEGSWRNMTTCPEDASPFLRIVGGDSSTLIIIASFLFALVALPFVVFGFLSWSRSCFLQKRTRFLVDTLELATPSRKAGIVHFNSEEGGGSMYVEDFD